MVEIKKVYIASPLFNPPEREENERIAGSLEEAGFKTFLPQRDGFLYVELVKRIEDEGCTREEAEKIALDTITHLDVYEVCADCDALVLNLNGRVPDEGAVSEGAMAFANELPLVIYKNDARSLVGGKNNPLVDGLTGFKVVDKIEAIPAELKRLEKEWNENGSSYSRMIKTARELFGNYDPKNRDLKELAKLGKQYFLDKK